MSILRTRKKKLKIIKILNLLRVIYKLHKTHHSISLWKSGKVMEA